ncbi:MAG: cytochrome c oxidase subunit II [Euzebya sp.]
MGGALDPAGPVSREMADLWWIMLGLGGGAFLVFATALVAALLRRRGSNDEDGVPRPHEEHPSRAWILVGGVVQPLVLVIIVFAATLLAMRAIPENVSSDGLVIEIVGHQWWYEIRYPDHDIVTANELHIPVGEPVELRLQSADVIHSFWIPQLGGKTDMLPDGQTTMVLQADEPGSYAGSCAEFCGLQHTRMAITAIALSSEDFDAWVTTQQQPAVEPSSQAEILGQEVFQQANCAQCHTIAGTQSQGTAGPVLTHFGSRGTIGAGTVANTTADLRAWLTDPDQIKEGAQMPAADLDAAQLDALVDYLRGLE